MSIRGPVLEKKSTPEWPRLWRTSMQRTSQLTPNQALQPTPENEGEGGAWYIPESAFTKEAANKALQNLSTQINKGVKGRDFLIDNDLKMIKGYLFISYLEEHKREFGTNDVSLKNQFCKFLRNEAFVSH